MTGYDLPKMVTVDGKDYPITNGGDFRVILDVISASEDQEIDEQTRGYLMLRIFYADEIPEDTQMAAKVMGDFIAGEEIDREEGDNYPKLVSWEKDFSMIAAAIQKSNGIDPRGVPYLHWWSFLGAYLEIDENTTFSLVVRIRQKLAKGKKLDESEKEFFRQNRKRVLINNKDDQEWLNEDF